MGRRLPTILHYGGSRMRKARDRVHLPAPAARENSAFPGNPATPADVMGWEPSKGSQTRDGARPASRPAPHARSSSGPTKPMAGPCPAS